jgi:hypothetical protein
MIDWNNLAQNIDQWAVNENTLINIRVRVSFIKAKRESNSGPQIILKTHA